MYKSEVVDGGVFAQRCQHVMRMMYDSWVKTPETANTQDQDQGVCGVTACVRINDIYDMFCRPVAKCVSGQVQAKSDRAAETAAAVRFQRYVYQKLRCQRKCVCCALVRSKGPWLQTVGCA